MIYVDLKKCPVKINYYTSERNPKDDILKIEYKTSSITIKPNPRNILIDGDPKELALGMALLVQGTLEMLDNDLIDEAFTFSKDGLINGYWIVANMQPVHDFARAYNQIYPTVLLLKE